MRRVAVALLLVVGVAVGFGLGFLFGRGRTHPQPRAAPTVLRKTVHVPKVIHVPFAVAVERVMGVGLAVGKVESRTGGQPGTIVAQFPPAGTLLPSESSVDLFVATSAYPRGWFEWCPDDSGTLPVRAAGADEAKGVALRFARAFALKDWEAVRHLLDHSALPLRRKHWTVAGKPARMSVFASAGGSRTGGPSASYGCGPRVGARTWAVTISDGTESASADFVLYLVRREAGWRVWASY